MLRGMVRMTYICSCFGAELQIQLAVEESLREMARDLCMDLVMAGNVFESGPVAAAATAREVRR